MKRIGWLISKYLLTTIIPYFVFSWLLLSVILFVQQASRFSDIFFSVNIPTNLVWQLTIALVPNVVAFTCPMAMLVGTIIGLTKMQGDSELTAIRASGVGNIQIAVPITLLGFLLSVFAFFVNLEGVPFAAGLVRNVALQTAIKKLESPIEPGVFNSEVAGYTIYVKDGDVETGRWQNIFIYSEDKANGSVRLITSQRGRIDTLDQASELVLEDAAVSTLPIAPGQGKYVTENIGEVRLAIKTRRSELVQKLSGSQISPEELGLQQLSEYADSKDGKERVEAQILWQRRIVLSITPLIFCLLGTVLVLRFNRGGRGFGSAVALAVLIGFYLLAFLGEQLARTGTINVILSSLLPIAGSLLAIAWFSLSRKFEFWSRVGNRLSSLFSRVKTEPTKVRRRNIFVDVTTGIRDFDVLRNLFKNFFLTLCFLTSIFLIFTAFELWKFAGTIAGGVMLLSKYLFYLLPFIYLQIAPSAAMIATLVTYVVKSRQNEIVTWASAGQSVYRLLAPCFLLMLLLGLGNWAIQERVLPKSNQRQDATRELIRNHGEPVNRPGKFWVANGNRIYSFELIDSGKASAEVVPYGPASDNEKTVAAFRSGMGMGLPPKGDYSNREAAASDNEWPDVGGSESKGKASSPILLMSMPRRIVLPHIIATAFASDNETQDAPCSAICAKNITIYEFSDKGAELQAVYRSDLAAWNSGKVILTGDVEKNVMAEGKITTSKTNGVEFAEDNNPFAELRAKPTHLNTGELKSQIRLAESELERRNLAVALEKKYTTLFLPFVMALFTAPFSLSLSRKGKAVTVGYAIGLWLLFTGTSSTFEQIGLNGMLSPMLAVWSPLIIFSLFGVYLLSKVRT